MASKALTEIFKHCPACGSNTIGADSVKSVACRACGFVYFLNAAAAVAALITNAEGSLLVTVRGHDPGKGWWDLPGGFVDAGETAEQALRREVREELNLEIEATTYFGSSPNEYVYKAVTYVTTDLAFVCRIEDFSPMQAMDDVSEIMFLPPENLDPARFYFASTRSFISAFIHQKSR